MKKQGKNIGLATDIISGLLRRNRILVGGLIVSILINAGLLFVVLH